jgi:hypothetical protein
VGQTGIRQTLEVIGWRNGGGKKTSPGDRHARLRKSLRHLSAVFVAGIEGGIGNKNIFGTGIL